MSSSNQLTVEILTSLEAAKGKLTEAKIGLAVMSESSRGFSVEEKKVVGLFLSENVRKLIDEINEEFTGFVDKASRMMRRARIAP